MRSKKLLLIPILFLLISGSLFSQMNFTTDARGGIFGEDQSSSFFMDGTGWIRILVDYREVYRGRGPAFTELSVLQGQARAFTLTAEYYSHIDELLESYSYYIYIDKITPPQPVLEFRNSNSGLSFIQTEGKQYTAVRAFADLGESLYFFDNLRRVNAAPPVSFPAIIWAEDWAGNISEPRQEFFEISLIKIANPVSDSFQNSQTLIITGIESEYVFWTIDGTYPLAHDGTGMLYRGPVRIDAYGDINIRIAWLDRSGRPREDRVSYNVAPNGSMAEGRGIAESGSVNGNTNGSPYSEPPFSLISHFYLQEESVIRSNTSLNIPDSWHWSINEQAPINPASVLANGELFLRPQNLVTRAVGVNLLDPEGNLYRFAYLLDGGGSNAPASRELYGTLPEIMFYSGYLIDSPVTYEDIPFREPDFLYPLLRYLRAGRSRLLIWPEEISGTIYFSWGDSWFSGNRPLPIPLEGGVLTWFVFIDEDTYYGPFVNEIEGLPVDRSLTRGRIAYQNNSPDNSNAEQGWNYVSDIIPYSYGILRNRNFDICDGEDLNWAFISLGGNILEELHLDRLPPAKPILLGYPEEGWTRGPLRIDLLTTEDSARGYINVRLVYPSGEVEILSGNEYIIINSSMEQIAEVYVTAFQIDAFGNRGLSVELFFVLDPNTIYVSPVPLLPASNPRAPLGGMDNPFSSLDDALSHAQRQGLTDVRVYGSLELNRPLRVFSMLHIDGGWRTPDENDPYGSLIITSDDFYWDLFPGSVLEISGVRILRGAANANLVNMDGATLYIDNSNITLMSQGVDRTPAFSARNSVIEISNSRIHVLGDNALMFNVQGGRIYTSFTTFYVSGERTAGIFSLQGSRGSFYNFIFRSSGEDYASVVEAENAELLLEGGRLSASARDANILFLDQSIAAIFDSHFELDALFSARVVNLRDSPFPLLQDNIFVSSSDAQRSEVFSGNNTVQRRILEAEGNEFHGFTHFMPGIPFE